MVKQQLRNSPSTGNANLNIASCSATNHTSNPILLNEKMAKPRPEDVPSTEEEKAYQISSLAKNHISNPMLLSDNAIQMFPIHQEMEILMDEQYITFINEGNVAEPTRRANAFITAMLCLQNVLLPEEDVEEIEISLVSEKESKIHALLLSVEDHFCVAEVSSKISKLKKEFDFDLISV